MTNTFRRALLTGAIQILWLFGAFTVLSALPLNISRISLRGFVGLFSMVILFTGVLYAIKKAKDENPTGLSYWQAVKTGITIAVVVACLVSLFSLLYLTLLNPTFAADMANETASSLKASGATAEQIEMEVTKLNQQTTIGIQLIQAMVLQSGMGSIFALIIGLFFRKK